MEKYIDYGNELENDICSIIDVYASKIMNDKDVTPYEMLTILTGGLLFPFLKIVKGMDIPLKNVQTMVKGAYDSLEPIDEEGDE